MNEGLKDELLSEEKFSKYGSSIFSEMGILAAKHNAVNLAQGFPDYQLNLEILQDASKYILEGQNQYAPMPGVQYLREQLSLYKYNATGHKYDPINEITVTTGALQALHCAIASIVSIGDEVIIFDPSFESYRPIVELYGGIPVTITLEAPNFNIPWDEIKKRINKKTKAIIINSPNNPTGKLITLSDIDALQKLTQNTDIVIISDEVYEHAIFNKQKHISISQFSDLVDRSFIISSLGKIFHVTGWRIGYCLAPEKLMKIFRKVHQFSVFSSSCAALQMSLANQVNNMDYYKDLTKTYDLQRSMFLNLISETEFKPLPIDGSFFCLLDYSELSSIDDVEMAKKLVTEFGVALIPLSSNYNDKRDQKILRACFVKKEETIKNAMLCLNNASAYFLKGAKNLKQESKSLYSEAR